MRNEFSTITLREMNKSHIRLNKRSQMKEFILYDSIVLKYKNSQDYSMLLEVRIVVRAGSRRGDYKNQILGKASGMLIMSLHLGILYMEVSSW